MFLFFLQLFHVNRDIDLKLKHAHYILSYYINNKCCHIHNIARQCAFVLWALGIQAWDAQTIRKETPIQTELPTFHGYIPRAHTYLYDTT
jgi:hypothetical protein